MIVDQCARGGATIAVTIMALLLWSAPPALPADHNDIVRITPAEPVQGDTLIVLVHTPAGAAVAVRYDGTPVPTFTLEAGLRRALLSTDPDTPVGGHAIAVTIIPPGGPPVHIIRMARVASGKFGVRRVTLSPQTAGLITSKNLALEWQALGPVLSRRTPVAWWRGPFRVPSTGEIDSPYGMQSFYNGRREWWHQGVDFSAPEGSPVTAANAGVVALAKALPLGGNTVVIDHGQGVLTEYIHLSAFAVRAGDRVEKGTLIGRIGATGLVTGPSLHWGLYAGGHWVNPLFWLEARPGLTS